MLALQRCCPGINDLRRKAEVYEDVTIDQGNDSTIVNTFARNYNTEMESSKIEGRQSD